MKLKRGYRVDIVVEGWWLGLLINFNVEVLKKGIHRKILGYDN